MQAFRPLRSRLTRLLASVLVVASLLGNGLALAQASPMPAKKPCCAEMMGHKHRSDGCQGGGEPCPERNAGCNEQCLLRCQSSAALPTVMLILPAIDQRQSAPASLPAGARLLADSAPRLRPPISA